MFGWFRPRRLRNDTTGKNAGIRLSSGNGITQLLRENFSEIGTRHRTRECSIEIACPLAERRNGNQPGVNAFVGTRSLVVGEKEDLILLDRTTYGSSELVLLEDVSPRGKEIFGIEVCVSQKLEAAAMELVGSRLGHNVYNAAAVIAVLRIEVVGQYTELGDRIEVGHDRCAAVHHLLDVASIDHEAIGVFSLATNRLVPGIQTTRGCNSDLGACHDNGV